jgi:hypothetical protein
MESSSVVLLAVCPSAALNPGDAKAAATQARMVERKKTCERRTGSGEGQAKIPPAAPGGQRGVSLRRQCAAEGAMP